MERAKLLLLCALLVVAAHKALPTPGLMRRLGSVDSCVEDIGVVVAGSDRLVDGMISYTTPLYDKPFTIQPAPLIMIM